MKVLIVNGPNLNLLGTREPEIYGNISMEDYLGNLRSEFPSCEIQYYQSNIEGEIINRLQEDDFDALVINPGAFTHYSYAIADCLKIFRSLKWRSTSVIFINGKNFGKICNGGKYRCGAVRIRDERI